VPSRGAIIRAVEILEIRAQIIRGSRSIRGYARRQRCSNLGSITYTGGYSRGRGGSARGATQWTATACFKELVNNFNRIHVYNIYVM
jgi:hypothetical protein